MNPHLLKELVSADGHRIRPVAWMPPDEERPSGVVQILHGLGEHIGRYQRFAMQCCERGFAVLGHDHRGHGRDSEPSMRGHFADRDGWDLVVRDAVAVQAFARQRWPRQPLIVFGHSMGSFIAQSAVSRGAGEAAALVLSASTFGPRLRLRQGRVLARLLTLRYGGRSKSPLLNRLGFETLNRPFAPNRTKFDWLSRDEAEVDRYIADPLCGFPLSNRLWYDLLGGMLEVTALRTLRRIPPNLPILVTGGESDPLGGRRGQRRLAQAMERTGHTDVALKLYPGARHEMLNEVNRDQYTADLLGWIESRI